MGVNSGVQWDTARVSTGINLSLNLRRKIEPTTHTKGTDNDLYE
jgi:hypothetical protein